MSLLSMLNSNSSNASAQYTLTNSASVLATSAQRTIDALSAKVAASAPGSDSGVTISAAAKATATGKADDAKDFSALGKEVRQALDAQYATAKANGKAAKPVLSTMTGRAVAAVALNRDGNFSRAEVAAAKIEMRERNRSDFISASSSGAGLAGLATYNKQLIGQYDGMSAEERQARGWTVNTRISAAAFMG